MSGSGEGHERWRQLIDATTQGANTRMAVRLEVAPSAPLLPDAVSEAFVGAAREAVRNISRHAGVEFGELFLRATPHSVVLEVSDRGRGMIADKSAGFGINDSIRARMEQVGGHAEINAGRNGEGTAVRLVWHPPRASPNQRIAEAYRLTMVTSGGSEIANTVVYPMLVANLIVALEASRFAAQPIATLTFACSLGAAALLAKQRLVQAAPGLATLFGWGFGMALFAGLGLLLAGPGAITGFQSFAVGFATLPLLLLAYATPVRYAPILIAPTVAVVALATILDPTVGVIGALGCFNAAVTPPLVSAALGAALRASAARIQEQRNRTIRAQQESKRSHYIELAKDQYLRHTEERILPWLDAVARGELDWTSRDAREQAILLGLEARDDLCAPGVFDSELRELVTDYRRRGGEVVVRSGVAPGASQGVLGQILRHLIRVLPPSHRLTVSAQPGTDSLRMVVVPSLPHDIQTQISSRYPEVLRNGDEFATVLRFEDIPIKGDAWPAA